MKEKIRFKNLGGWLKFGAIVSIVLGILYSILILTILLGLVISS